MRRIEVGFWDGAVLTTKQCFLVPPSVVLVQLPLNYPTLKKNGYH
jgi:hypothetical protein